MLRDCLFLLYIHIYVEHRVEDEAQKSKKNTYIYIYEEHRVEHRFFKKPETFLILEASGLPKAETFTIFHSPMFAKGLQKSSKHVQPRNSSVEHL